MIFGAICACRRYHSAGKSQQRLQKPHNILDSANTSHHNLKVRDKISNGSCKAACTPWAHPIHAQISTVMKIRAWRNRTTYEPYGSNGLVYNIAASVRSSATDLEQTRPSHMSFNTLIADGSLEKIGQALDDLCPDSILQLIYMASESTPV
ncbi:hypothetical protein M501DRAFT_672852 [Patellaria atrata CBS 101060]|uniref:Uncharacterized protein n=1 Tax=Patellaria atrata CBS 101060 TaxID=1346257 RepID=A0A9P4SCE2_9PEZI|nr:hypothetical protein M501DRAFT_672852 [Patellaria atrata CBS 101060]